LSIIFTLLGYPISILAGLTAEKIISISNKVDIVQYEKLFIRSFEKAIKYHIKRYDDTARDYLEFFLKANKKNNYRSVLTIFYRPSNSLVDFLNSIQNRSFQTKIAEKILETYINIETNKNMSIDLMTELISDSLRFYRESFISEATTNESLGIVLTQCLKISNIIDLLKDINSNMINKNDFDQLKKMIIDSHLKINPKFQKSITEYCNHILIRIKYIEQRGFSPKVSGREIKMELDKIFVPIQMIIDKHHGYDTTYDEDLISNKYIELLTYHRAIVVLGDPGSGKSTLLKYLARQIILNHLKNSVINNILPIYIRIAEYADYYNSSKKPITSFIKDYLPEQFEVIINDSFECSNVLLLFDGLDEIIDTSLRIIVVDKVQELISMYPYCRYVVSTRIIGYNEASFQGDITHFRILPFNNNQIGSFTKQWFEAIAKSSNSEVSKAVEEAAILYNAIIENISVLRLATNPLLMTIIAMIHFKGKTLPKKRIELYDICTETFLEYWVKHKFRDSSRIKDKSDIIELMSPIAFHIHESISDGLIDENSFRESFIKEYKKLNYCTNKEARIEFLEFKRFLQNYTGFFHLKGIDDKNNNWYGFIHLTFEEYLSAIEMIKLWHNNDIQLSDFIFDNRWLEIIRLACALLSLSKGIGRNEASQFLSDIMYNKKTIIEYDLVFELVILILIDEVDLTKELLGEIVSSTKASLCSVILIEDKVNSIKLFRSLFKSKYGKLFLKEFKDELKNGNKIFIDNISTILVENNDLSFVNKTLSELINDFQY
jgi:predicted NACHT family NTPase